MKYKDLDEKQLQTNLAELRKQRGLTQKDVEGELKLRALSMYDYESGRLKLPIDLALKICNLYHSSLYELLGINTNEDGIDSNKGRESRKFDNLLDIGIMESADNTLIQAILEDPIILSEIGMIKADAPKPPLELITKNLTEVQKRNFIVELLKYLNSVIGSDGKISEEEILFRNTLISKVPLSLDEAEVNSIRKCISRQYFGKSLRKNLPKEGLKHFTLWTMCLMALSDKHFNHKEEEYIEQVAEHIGVSKFNFNHIKDTVLAIFHKKEAL